MLQLTHRISVFALAAVALSAQTATTPAEQVTRTTGMAGIAEGQTAQLNALNLGVASPAATGIICSGLLSFVDDTGQVLKSATVNSSKSQRGGSKATRRRMKRKLPSSAS